METQYTPGPWRLDNDELRSGVFSDNENYHGIEAGDGYLKDGQGFNCTGFMTKADAQLIAAAPGLYEALNDLLNDCINFDNGNLTLAFQEKASDALRKARGEQ